MEIVHEPPHKELTFFARAPLKLRVADQPDVVIDAWCVSGVCKPEGMDVFPTRGTLSIPFQGIDLGFPVKLSADASGDFYAFEDLTVRQREVLALFHSNLLSGRMASTQDMITALDTPVDLVPMGETEEEEAAATAHVPSRAFRLVKALLTYLAAAVLIFGLLGQSVILRVMTIPTVQARVIAPEVTHVSTAPAYIDKIMVQVGDSVARGDTLIRMSDPRREGRLDDARRALNDKEHALTEARALLRKHEATYPQVLETLEAQLEAALARQGERHIPGPQADVDAIRAAVRALEDGRSLRSGDYHDIRADLVATRNARKEDVRRAKRAVGIAKADARLLDIKAQVAGTVRDVTALQDMHVARGTPLAVVEENAPRTIRTWVDEAHLTRLAPGMTAQMTVPTPEGPQQFEGEVLTVVAGVDESAAKRGFGLIVTVATPPQTQLTPLSPVDLRIRRAWVPEWIH
ncbi:HlyD family secretion protein [Tateyamaria sp. syn59]|uniref:HlyD family secretion protein n=1 Tax=Tateyamaria sp. syn59 TaxID=2576942 RepID=UPI001674D5A3|nr:HlyD family efflux transporter periplasmic adaptor subunit [Tateyamaria sp. syn59]